MEKVFAMTLTDLPEVPYWRAGDTVDCMVYVLYKCECDTEKNGKIQGVQDGGSGIKWVWRARMGAGQQHVVVFYPGARSRSAVNIVSAPYSRPRNTPTSAIASFSASTRPPFCQIN